MIVYVEAIAQLVVGSTVDSKPTCHHLLKGHELDEIVGDSKKEIVASNDLKPF